MLIIHIQPEQNSKIQARLRVVVGNPLYCLMNLNPYPAEFKLLTINTTDFDWLNSTG